MTYEDLSARAQDVLRLGCNALQIDIQSFFDSLKAEVTGAEKYLCGWKEIATALGLSNWRSAFWKAKEDDLLRLAIKKYGHSVRAKKADIEFYMNRRSVNWK